MACVNKMRAGQQQGPSAMSSETVTIKLYKDTDFSHTICGFDTMSGGRVKAKKRLWEDTSNFSVDVQYKQSKIIVFHNISKSNLMMILSSMT